MAKPRKLWSQLADSTKKKYKRKGITPQQYNAGKVTREQRDSIYGRNRYWMSFAIAKQQGLDTVLKRAGILDDYKRLPVAKRRDIANKYREGLIQGRGKPMKPGGGFEKLNLPYQGTVHPESRVPNLVVVPGKDSKGNDREYYFRREYTSTGKEQLIPVLGYGHPIRTEESFLTEQDFIRAIEDQLGTVLDEADLWNDERRSALDASSP